MTEDEAISRAPGVLHDRLRWFAKNKGKRVLWSEIRSFPEFLFTLPKGIFKPEGSIYTLSVKETLDSPYADKPIEHFADGSWKYSYFQEGEADSSDKNLLKTKLCFSKFGIKSLWEWLVRSLESLIQPTTTSSG